MEWLKSRFKEGSTWGGLAGVAASVGTAFPDVAPATTALAGVLAFVAFLLKDKTAP